MKDRDRKGLTQKMVTVPIFSKLAVHTITTKPWSLREALDGYAAAGVSGITLWRDAIEGAGLDEAVAMLADSPLDVVGLARGGFFPAETASERQAAINDNRILIDMAEATGAPVLVLVCGAWPGQSLEESRKQIGEGIAALLEHASQAGVRLAIEPLHPMYADTRSAVVSVGQANDLIDTIGDERVGIALDVYHTWWDDRLEAEIQRAGQRICAFHICDWRVPTRDFLTDRTIMGEGCIDIPRIRGWVEAAGFDGHHEVEIFSEEYWAMDQGEFLARIVEAYRELA